MMKSFLAVAMLFAVSAGSTWALERPCATETGTQGQQASARKGRARAGAIGTMCSDSNA